ncbi:MAG: glutathione S-transferase family protein [Alphaproteobacteria bacterium]|nr:glutathione S-transferase family protein [Alphaproteobacteria bacterium]
MKLWSAQIAPNPRRVVIYLMEKGIELETVDIDLGAKENFTPEFMAINPLARVPVLELDDGTFLTDSKALCRYLEELHPEPALMGTDARDRANVEMWDRRIEIEIMQNMTGAFRHSHPYWEGRIEQVPDFGDLCRRNAEAKMAWLDSEIAGRDFIAGDSLTIADITAICAFGIGRIARIKIPEELEKLSAWHARMSERDSVIATGPKPK